MTSPDFELLPERSPWQDFVDDSEFSEVTEHGEVYTLYQVIRFTHIATNHPEGWTHQANVTQVRSLRIGVALLSVVDRIIVDAKVTLSPTYR